MASVTYTGTCLRPSWTATVWPTMSGMIVERRDQVLMTFFSPLALSSSTLRSRWSSTKGPFFRERGMGLPPRAAGTAAAHDELVGLLVLRACAALDLAPGRHRVASTGGLALATTEGVVDRVHGHAAGLRAHALPAVAARLAHLDQLVLGVAHLADRGAAVDRHPAHLGRRQAQGGVRALLGQQYDRRPGRTGHLAPGAGPELDVVHRGAHGDVAQRQGVAGTDLGALSRLQHVADADVAGRQDVALVAVEVVQQCDAARPVGVVLDGGHLGGDAVLVAAEVDHPVPLLVAATAVARRLAAVDVAPAGGGLLVDQRPLGAVAGQLGEVRDRLEPAAGAGGLALAECHRGASPLSPGTGRSNRPR